MLQFGLLALILMSLYKPKKRNISLVILRKGNKVLLLKRSSTDSWRPNHWALPGGHVEPGESYRAAAIREIKEETNIDISNPQLIAIEGSTHLYETSTDQNPNLAQASHGFEHSDWIWASKRNIPSPLVPNIDKIIFS